MFRTWPGALNQQMVKRWILRDVECTTLAADTREGCPHIPHQVLKPKAQSPNSSNYRQVTCREVTTIHGVAFVDVSGNILALSSFWAVATTFGNSWMAGRNFSCKSQMLEGY